MGIFHLHCSKGLRNFNMIPQILSFAYFIHEEKYNFYCFAFQSLVVAKKKKIVKKKDKTLRWSNSSY